MSCETDVSGRKNTLKLGPVLTSWKIVVLSSHKSLGMLYRGSKVNTFLFIKYHSVYCHQFHRELFMHSVQVTQGCL